jgi:hypothetical protein
MGLYRRYGQLLLAARGALQAFLFRLKSDCEKLGEHKGPTEWRSHRSIVDDQVTETKVCLACGDVLDRQYVNCSGGWQHDWIPVVGRAGDFKCSRCPASVSKERRS